MSNTTIENLVLRAQKGDKTAYAELIRLQYKRIFLLCYGVIGDEHHAEDVAQEVFLKGFVKLKTLRRPDQFDRWIGKIAKNHALSFIQRKEKHLSLQENTPEQVMPVVEQDRFFQLNHAIRQLPVDLRTPLVMYYFDGRNVPTVAKTLGISNSNVYLRLRTAVSKLKELISQGDIT